MLTLIYLLAVTGATANPDAEVVTEARPAPVTYTPPLSESERLLLRKQGFAEPRGNPGDWVNTADYPATAIQEKRTGMTAFRVKVDRSGRVSSCEETVSSGHSDLDGATCKYVAERAIFYPALDEKERPTSGVYENKVRWQIPNDPVIMPSPGTFTLMYTIEKDGSVSDCKVTGSAADNLDLCADAPVYVPPVNKNGDPVRKQVIISTATRVGELADKQ